MKRFILTTFLFQLITIAVFSQARPVAIHTSSGTTFNGYVISIDSLSVTLTKGWSKKALDGKKGFHFIPIYMIEKIDLKGSNRVGGGVVAGGGVGLALGVGVLENEKNREPDFDTGTGLQIGIVSFFGAVGGGIGGLIGIQIRKTEMEYVINRDPVLLNLYLSEFISD